MTNVSVEARAPRESRTRERVAPAVGLLAVGLAVALGVFADLLFNGAALGINVPLWLGALIGSFVLVARRNGTPIGRLPAGLLAVSLGLAAMTAWRSATALQVALLGASAGLLLFALVIDGAFRARRPSISLVVLSLAYGAASVTRGTVLLPLSVRWRALLGGAAPDRARRLSGAAVIAAPLVLLFGGLFFAADAVFAAWIKNALAFDPSAVVGHLRWVFGGATVAAGMLWCGITVGPTVPAGPELAETRRLRAAETSIVLGSLGALFALFVSIQVQYLFGGDQHVQTSLGLTYAEYARRGFFELVAVAALLLPVILAADWARSRTGRSLTTFRVLSGLLVALLFIVMLSALQRLRIYVDTFGLTALRFYAAALLVWLTTAFGWLLWSLLRERRNEFVAGAVTTALIALVIVVAINPHGTVAATNLARAEDGRDFDVVHALRLSADATPTLIDGLDALPAADRCEIALSLLDRRDGADDDLWSWNWGRAAAAAAVETNRDRLLAACR